MDDSDEARKAAETFARRKYGEGVHIIDMDGPHELLSSTDRLEARAWVARLTLPGGKKATMSVFRTSQQWFGFPQAYSQAQELTATLDELAKVSGELWNRERERIDGVMKHIREAIDAAREGVTGRHRV